MTTNRRGRRKKWVYDTRPKYILDTTATAGFHWTDHRIYFTEQLWDLVHVPSDPSGLATANNVRSVFYALWCKIFNCHRDTRRIDIDVPIAEAKGEEPIILRLWARHEPASESPSRFTIGAPGEATARSAAAPRSRLNLTVRWDTDPREKPPSPRVSRRVLTARNDAGTRPPHA